MAEELDDATWGLLDGPGQHANDMGLGMLVKMTRCHDLGLGQLFFPELELDSDSTCNEETEEETAKWDEKGDHTPAPPDLGNVGQDGVAAKLEALQLTDSEVHAAR